MRISRRVPLAWLNLTENGMRLLASVAGVAFAVVLMFVEMGFLHGMYDSQTHVVDLLNADLVMIHRQKEALVPVLPFAKVHLIQARAFAEVQAVFPVYIEEYRAVWKNSQNGREYPILVFGINPDDPVFLIPEVRQQAAELKLPDTALIDSQSKPFYGILAPGVTGELAGRTVRLVGTFPLGPDFRVDGNLIVGERTFFRCFADPQSGRAETGRVELGLIKLAAGADALATCELMEQALPDDIRVLTKAEFCERIKGFWGNSKPIGYVFGLGMFVGFLIGVVICYQILFTDINRRLPQFATLKAIGFQNRYIAKTVLQQSVFLALLGFVPGVLTSLAIYGALQAYSGIPMRLTIQRTLVILVLTIAMCVVAGAIAARRVMRADPAELF